MDVDYLDYVKMCLFGELCAETLENMNARLCWLMREYTNMESSLVPS
jgi:hypothetical protein